MGARLGIADAPPLWGALDRGPYDGGCVTEAASTSELRAGAMALPEVTEKQHFGFELPRWPVGDDVAAWEQWGWRLGSSTVPRRERAHRPPDPDRIDHRSSWAIAGHVAPRRFSARARRACLAPAPSGGRCGIRMGDRRYRSPQ
jgi:hypothetical protein